MSDLLRQSAIAPQPPAAGAIARATAEVQARFVVAAQRPRDTETARVRILHECERPAFAAIVEYAKPVGKEKNNAGEWVEKIARGPSVHLIRTAMRLFGNMSMGSEIVAEDDESRTIRITGVDWENNYTKSRDISIPSTVEKRPITRKGNTFPPPGREILSERVNSSGETVYICRATDEEMRIAGDRMAALAERALGEHMLPRDIIQEALDRSKMTLQKADAADPDAAVRRAVDGFLSQFRIEPTELEAYVGKKVAKFTPDDLAELRRVFLALRDGEATWAEFMEARNPSGSVEEAAEVAEKKIAELRGATLGEKKEEIARKLEEHRQAIHSEALAQKEALNSEAIGEKTAAAPAAEPPPPRRKGLFPA